MKANKLLKIEQELCMKCGGCVAVYPDVFQFDTKGEVYIVEDSEIEIDDLDKIKGVCPFNAIVDVQK